MHHLAYRRRRKGVDKNAWARWKIVTVAKGMSQKEIADALHFDQADVSRWLRGIQDFGDRRLLRVNRWIRRQAEGGQSSASSHP
jgi:predicted restriction endonuclease